MICCSNKKIASNIQMTWSSCYSQQLSGAGRQAGLQGVLRASSGLLQTAAGCVRMVCRCCQDSPRRSQDDLMTRQSGRRQYSEWCLGCVLVSLECILMASQLERCLVIVLKTFTRRSRLIIAVPAKCFASEMEDVKQTPDSQTLRSMSSAQQWQALTTS